MPFDYDFRMQIGAPRPTVFERLLRIEHLSRWFCGWCRIEPKVGGSFKFGGETCILPPEGRAWETKIDEGDVLQRFAFTWPIRASPTRVSYELEDGPGDTTVIHARHGGVPIRATTCGSVQDAWRMCLGNLKSIAEGRGDSVRPDHSPVASEEVRLSVLIEASPANVFAAFVNPGDVAHWSTGGTAGGPVARVEPRSGGIFSFGSGEAPDQVQEWDASRRIILQSQEATKRGVQFDFEEKASGTAVYLLAKGFPNHGSEEILRQRGRWSDRLVCLKNFVESGSSGFLNTYEDQVRRP
ncbi:MAG: SRPBCC domain-containing protein [Thermoplasmata archaeon]